MSKLSLADYEVLRGKMGYTTIRRKVGEYDVLMTDDPHELTGCIDLKKKNLIRVKCVECDKWCTFLMSKEMLKFEGDLVLFITKTIQHHFKRLK